MRWLIVLARKCEVAGKFTPRLRRPPSSCHRTNSPLRREALRGGQYLQLCLPIPERPKTSAAGEPRPIQIPSTLTKHNTLHNATIRREQRNCIQPILQERSKSRSGVDPSKLPWLLRGSRSLSRGRDLSVDHE